MDKLASTGSPEMLYIVKKFLTKNIQRKDTLKIASVQSQNVVNK